MKLFELFDENIEHDLVARLREDMIDILMPLAAHGVPYIKIDNVIDRLREMRPGIEIDRPLIMTVLDPNDVKMVTKIEGDRVYFTIPAPSERAVDDQQKERDKERVSKKAQAQAKKAVSKGPLG